MERLLIIGAGAFGREVFGWAMDLGERARGRGVAGFLDTNPRALEGYQLPFEVIGDPNVYSPREGDLFICAIGDPATKLRLCREIRARGGRFAQMIHPSAIIGQGCRIGEGCVLCPGAVLTTNVQLGSFVTLNVYASIGHDAVIGEGCTLHSHSDVTGRVVLGEGVLIGSHGTVLPGAKVGDYSIVGAGSVVLRRVPPRTTVMGVPAKLVGGFSAPEGASGLQVEGG
jgi:sugar O-acyltransferase (sialic acid O-acetyltransferase NeuD family)